MSTSRVLVTSFVTLGLTALASIPSSAQVEIEDELVMERPIPALNTIWIEEMTWMDVRDALQAGKTTAIISTGGVEPNGPWLVTGKHNYVLRENCPRIATYLGNALCAPVLELVPEGGIEPQTGHMTSPGTISLRQETFEAVLTDMAESLHQHGFENIVFIGERRARPGTNSVVFLSETAEVDVQVSKDTGDPKRGLQAAAHSAHPAAMVRQSAADHRRHVGRRLVLNRPRREQIAALPDGGRRLGHQLQLPGYTLYLF